MTQLETQLRSVEQEVQALSQEVKTTHGTCRNVALCW